MGLTAFKDEVVLWFKTRLGAHKDLAGEWDCIWKKQLLDDQNRAAADVPDVVRIDKVAGALFKGRGPNYLVSGRAAHRMVTVSWYDAKNNDLGGVAVLKQDDKEPKMRGHWCQYSGNGEFHGGEVTWIKKAEMG